MLGTNATLGIVTPVQMPNPTPGGLFWVEGFPPQELTDAGWVPWTGEAPKATAIRELQGAYMSALMSLCSVIGLPVPPIPAVADIVSAKTNVVDPTVRANATELSIELTNLEGKLCRLTNTETIDAAMRGYVP